MAEIVAKCVQKNRLWTEENKHCMFDFPWCPQCGARPVEIAAASLRWLDPALQTTFHACTGDTDKCNGDVDTCF